jgi:hypothetical protein
MAASHQNIEKKLNTCALIIRKYDLGGREYFFSKFPEANKDTLETAWLFGLKKIQNKEIVKDSGDLGSDQHEIIRNKLKAFDYNSDNVYYYLNSEFDSKKLKLLDENIERNLRNKLAIRYVQIISEETIALNKKAKNAFRDKVSGTIKNLRYGLIAIAVVAVFSAPRIIDGLTSVDSLSEKIHEKSKYKFNGSICNDGTISHSQGRGTCSWHGGVNYKFYKGDYSKTIEECRKEAEKISWRN